MAVFTGKVFTLFCNLLLEEETWAGLLSFILYFFGVVLASWHFSGLENFMLYLLPAIQGCK